jgi:hypothetical protein
MSDGDDLDLPDIVIGVIAELCEQLLFLHEKIASYCLKMAQAARREKRVALIQTIPPLVHVNMHCRAAGYRANYNICHRGHCWHWQTIW